MSLRARLLLVLGAVTIAALAVADVAIYSALHASLLNQVDQTLEQNSAPFVHPNPGGFGLPPRFESRSSECPPVGARDALISSNYRAVFPNGDRADVNECAAIVGGHSYTPRLPATFTGFTAGPDGTHLAVFGEPSTEKGGPDFRVRVTKLADGTEVVVAAPITDTEHTLHRLLLIELGVSAVAVLAAVLAGLWLVRLGLRPLTSVERTAEQIAGGDLQHRVPDENDRTEVGRLATTLNVMLGRIESAFAARLASEERLRRFVGDASHELRTPIAAVSAYAELFERGAAGNTDDLTRVMTGIRSETARMDRLVADLLTLARLDEGETIEHVPVELVTLCAEAAQTARTVAPEWPLALVAARPVEVDGDPHRLRQVLDNLLANVRSHTPAGTEAEVRVEEIDDRAVVVVSDRGPGVPEEEAGRVLERFYRSDPSRSRTKGGSGLGLSIVVAIVEAHGGSVQALSAPGEGMTITISLPASHEPDPGAGAVPGLVEPSSFR
ncbi:MAG: sensor histidine kinase [Acidimicrobiales bacterium]